MDRGVGGGRGGWIEEDRMEERERRKDTQCNGAPVYLMVTANVNESGSCRNQFIEETPFLLYRNHAVSLGWMLSFVERVDFVDCLFVRGLTLCRSRNSTSSTRSIANVKHSSSEQKPFHRRVENSRFVS